jgi:hypothetical protein
MSQSEILSAVGDSKWFSEDEKKTFLADVSWEADSNRSTEQLYSDGIGPSVGNKCGSISLFKADSPENVLDRNPTAPTLVACPTVPVSPGDFLGVLPGLIHYQNLQPSPRAIPGPVDLWLDTADATGPLSQMYIAASEKDVNVTFAWEGVNLKGGKFCDYWRILAIAIRAIKPFEPLIRPSFL